MKKFLTVILLLCSITIAGCAKATSNETGYPEKPIVFVVPFAAGGGAQIAAETFVPDAEKFLGQPVQIDCRDGAGGAIGASYVAQAKPDGYTLLATTLSVVTAPHLGDVAYSIEDFIPIAQFTEQPHVLAVKSDSPWLTAEDLVNWAKEHPGELTWAFTGVGSAAHIQGSNAFSDMGIIDLVKEVPYTGAAPSVAAVLGGHVNVFSGTYSPVAEQVRAGKLRVIGVSGQNRLEDLPDVPTFDEQGYGSLLTSWRGIFAPKDTPEEVIDYLNEKLGELIQDPAFAERVKQIGEPLIYKNSEDFTKMYKEQYQVIGELTKKLGISK